MSYFLFRIAAKEIVTLKSKGLRHLAFVVENVEEWIIFLRNQQVEVQDVRIDETTGKKFTFFNDPDGQPLELYEE